MDLDDSEIIDSLISEALSLCMKNEHNPILAMMHIHDSISKSLRNYVKDEKRKFNDKKKKINL